jgi:putative effector of murein hydrolase
MISADQRFYIFILMSFVAFFAILRFVMRRRAQRPAVLAALGVAAVVVVGGMLFAKFTQNAGWPWWIYYTVPALVTLALPPVAFRFTGRELWQYLVLAFLSSPVIHVLFSFFLGWHEYMPFIPVPSLRDILA